MAEPFAQFGARRDLFEPKVNPGSPFRYASRPEPIDQHPETVVSLSRPVSSSALDHSAIPGRLIDYSGRFMAIAHSKLCRRQCPPARQLCNLFVSTFRALWHTRPRARQFL